MNAHPLMDKYYFQVPSFMAGTPQFHQLLRSEIPAGGRILEIGAGPANKTSRHLSSLGEVAGLDIDDDVESNEHLSERHVYDGHEFPLPDEVFDACVSNYVLEHVEKPAEHFREAYRVLKPGGCYCFRTPNLWHYISIAARLLPHWIHLFVANRLLGMTGVRHDPYPTYHRANTRASIRKFCRQSGFKSVRFVMVETEPSYGASSPLLFYPMMMYERFVNSSGVWRFLRANIYGVAYKQASDLHP